MGIGLWLALSQDRAQYHLKTRRVGQRCTLNLSRAETSSRWCGVVVRRGVPAQVSSTSLDHGSKLRGPSPKALVCDVNIQSINQSVAHTEIFKGGVQSLKSTLLVSCSF
ncbi:uncharacterized protein TNCV_4622611 [Trichonephila clavipes]|nr:uncharacterized protein TNCV_4622611 [Trichonephila clavipes]